MTPLCWLDPRHVPAVCHVGFSTNLPAATAAALVVPLPNIRQRSPDFYSSSSKKTPPMKLQFASAVFWERVCHYCRTVINIWPESGSGLALQCPLNYIYTPPLKVSGNPVKTLMPIKTGWCWVSNFCLIPFPDPIMVHAIAEKTKNKKNPAEGWKNCQAIRLIPLMKQQKLVWQYKSKERLVCTATNSLWQKK